MRPSVLLGLEAIGTLQASNIAQVFGFDRYDRHRERVHEMELERGLGVPDARCLSANLSTGSQQGWAFENRLEVAGVGAEVFARVHACLAGPAWAWEDEAVDGVSEFWRQTLEQIAFGVRWLVVGAAGVHFIGAGWGGVRGGHHVVVHEQEWKRG